MAEFLFDQHGSWIAFRTKPGNRYLYNKSARWIGWFPWGDGDAVTPEGAYRGTVVGNRLLRRTNQPYRGYPGYTGYAGYCGYQSGYGEVSTNLLNGG